MFLSWLSAAVVVLSCVQNARNVNAFTTRSYDLDVPGSKPIRIIEADPGWDLNTRKPPIFSNRNERVQSDRAPQALDSIKSNYKPFVHRGEKDDRFKHRPDFEHRTLKPDIISNRNDRFPPASNDEEDNSEKLKKFLNSYAQNVKNINVQVDNLNSNLNNDEDQIHLDDKYVDIPSEEHNSDENRDKPEKSKSWNLLHFDKIQQGPQDNKGWVSMDAVPWSVSKISKWHGKPKKDKYQNQNNGYYDQGSRPYNDRFQTQTSEYPRPNYPKPIRPIGVHGGHRPNGYYDDPLEEGDVEDPVEEEDYFNKRPSFPRPSATYGHKVNLHTVQTFGNPGNGNKRPFNNKDNCNNNQHNHHNFGHVNFGHDNNDDGIITDGLPANFPEHDYGNRRRGVAGDSAASGSASHPFKGDGEWVLLSTTKGYKYPKNPRQRSLRFTDTVSDGSDNRLQSLHTHKSVRLTVLPPLDDGRVNMTTSHGGLLQVDGTFQSVEEAQKQHAKRQKLKARPHRRPLKIRPQLAQLESFPISKSPTVKQQQQIQYQLQNGDNIVAASAPSSSVSDSSAVLAAVGAGMIPAGMALLVPMAMSGKRKKRSIKFPEYLTVSPYTNSVELTLPSSL